MDYYVDVLDHTGRTPRELGAVHIHVEPVTRGPSGEAIAVVWLQSAFEPLPMGEHTLLVMGQQKDGPARRMLGQFPVPRLDGGRVVRWRLPLELPLELDELHFQVSGKPHPKAERVRPAWKLLDVLEVPKESDLFAKPLSAPSTGITGLVAGAVISTAIMGAPVFSISFGERRPHNPRETRITRHAAAASPTAFIAPVVAGPVEPLSKPQLETVWTPGDALPAPVSVEPEWQRNPPERPVMARRELRTCTHCFFSGDMDDYEDEPECPACHIAWY